MKAYGYIRVSTRDQAEGGQSLAAQREAIQRWYQAMLAHKGYEWGGIVEEEPVTASKPLVSRPRGMRMSSALEKGDYVLFAKLDRGFRCTRDLLTTVEVWSSRGVLVRFLDLDVDTGTAAGELHLTIMGAVAKFELERLRERIRAIHAYKRSKGMLASGNPPLGWKLKKVREGCLLVPDEYERGVALRCLEWFNKHFTVSQIYRTLKEQSVQNRKGGWISRTQVWSLIQAAKYDFPKGGIRALREHASERRPDE